MAQPTPESQLLPIEVRFVLGDGQALGPAVTYTPTTWAERVEAIRPHLTPMGTPVCPISCEPIPPEHGRSEEHIVPQALGLKWVHLPAGMVDDRVNNALSDCELDLFRTGTTSFLRPMFVTARKSTTFASGPGRSVTVGHDPERGVELHLRGGEAPAGPTGDAGPGELHVSALVPQPRPDLTSRALCKAAYLALVVHAPELALRDEFAQLRDWLLERRPGDARRYGEKMIVGAGPGAEFRYLVGCDAEGEGEGERTRITALRWVIAHVRFHAVGFWVALLNEPPEFDEMLKGDPGIRWFEDPEFFGRPRRMTFTFSFSGATRRHPDPL